jgi:hypothetical protein
VRIVVAPFFTTGATLVLISRLVGTNVRDDLVAGFVGDRRRGERGRGAPQRERQVCGGEVTHVERPSGIANSLYGGVDAARRAGEVGELLLIFRERELKVADVSRWLNGRLSNVDPPLNSATRTLALPMYAEPMGNISYADFRCRRHAPGR